MQVLLVEDDISLASGLQLAFKKEGITINHVTKGQEAIHVVETFPPDIMVLDLGLPDIDGLDVISYLRKQNISLPIIVLTARGSIEEKVTGLDSGADDYLAKPFDMDELLARVRVLERRISTSKTSNQIVIGDVSLDSKNWQIQHKGELIVFSKTEFILLKSLMQNADRVQTRDYLESQLYSWGEEISSNALEVHIHHLRKKLGSDFIKTVRGVGYTVKKS